MIYEKYLKRNKRIILSLLILSSLAILIFLVNFNLTGNAIVNLDSRINENFELSLQKGELIPLSSKVKIYTEEGEKEYFLNNLVSQNPLEGKYYLEGISIEGYGEGIGEVGKKIEYPKIYFKFKIIRADSSSSGDEEITSNETNSEENETEVLIPETAQESPNSENIVEENNSEEIIDEPLEENSPEIEEIQVEETPEEINPEGEEGIEEDSTDSNFELGMTGNIIREEEIQAEVSYGSNFEYILDEGEAFEIIADSVMTEGKGLSDSELEITKEGNKIIVTTNYTEIIEGFGEDYLGEEIKISLNKSKINETFDKITKIELIVEESQEEVESEIPIEEIPGENLTAELNETLEINITETNISKEEKIVLDNLGTFEVSLSQYEYRDKIIVKMKIRNYEREFSYSQTLDNETLSSLIGKDKEEFIADLARKFTEEKFEEIELY